MRKKNVLVWRVAEVEQFILVVACFIFLCRVYFALPVLKTERTELEEVLAELAEKSGRVAVDVRKFQKAQSSDTHFTKVTL